MNLTKQKVILMGTALYVLSTVASFGAFRVLGSEGTISLRPLPTNLDGSLAVDPEAPKTEECPLNGDMFTKVEREAWEQRRPLAIMVENSVEARPHSGLNKADIIYEAVAEGGVTRFMPIFYCEAQASNVVVAPVRSVRTYYIDWASEYVKPLFGHVGGANCSAEKLPNGKFGPCKSDVRAQAIEQLSEYGWRYRNGNDLDQFALGAPAYIRNETRLGKQVATEHSVEGYTEQLWAEAVERGWTNEDPDGEDWQESFRSWEFKDGAGPGSRGQVSQISYDFWDGYKQFDASWNYNQETNEYLRSTGGEPHVDLETKEQLSVKNVVVLFTKEYGSIDELKHNLYDTIGNGEALIFQDGNVIEGFWEKKSRTARTIFTTKKGEEVAFTRGPIWISVVGLDTTVSY